MSEEQYTIALLGQPNSGKSTLFNALTGSRQHVGNWPGKTVEKKEGFFTYNKRFYQVTDLPGSYSLSAASEEEIVTRDYIAEGQADLVCILADASQLERSLFMLADYIGINTPAILLLNMIDVAKAKGKRIDTERLSYRLGIPVIPFVAADRKGYDAFYQTIEAAVTAAPTLNFESFCERFTTLDHPAVAQLLGLIPENGIGQYSRIWLAAKALEGDRPAITLIESKLSDHRLTEFRHCVTTIEQGGLLSGDCKFHWISDLLADAVENEKKELPVMGRFDRLATSKKWGKWLALGIILLGLIGSFIPAAPIMGVAEMIPKVLRPPITHLLIGWQLSPFLIALIADGFLNALYMSISMTGFVFGILLVFGLIEEIGYMARISYVFDNLMAHLGLQGKAIMPFIVSLGCTIGGAAGTRVIDNWGQRMLTMALLWSVPCGAIFAVIPTLAKIFFGWGAALVMLLVFLIMVLHMILTARIFGNRLSPKTERTGMIMELPPFHKPRWGSFFHSLLLRIKDIFIRVFKVIFIMSTIFFLLSYSADGNVEHSMIYIVGRLIEPVTLLFGLSWKTFMAFVSSAISKEAVLGVLNALYTSSGSVYGATMQTTVTATNFSTLLTASISKPEALAFMIAVSFNTPCLMAVASTYQESHSLKWTLRITGYYMITALLLSFVVFHVSSLFF